MRLDALTPDLLTRTESPFVDPRVELRAELSLTVRRSDELAAELVEAV